MIQELDVVQLCETLKTLKSDENRWKMMKNIEK